MSEHIPILDMRNHARLARVPARTVAPVGILEDALSRPLRDLRISVTDRCNFRCVYCMPKEVFDKGYSFLPQRELLTFEEIYRLAEVFVAHGVQKLRLTGGEPLLRKNIEQLIAMLRLLRTPEGAPVELTLTTNASLLARKAQSLKDAGLDRITVSLDALDDQTFRKMNDVDFPVSEVLRGMDVARAAGFAPLKVNMVVKRGVNDAQIVAMARYFKQTGDVLRFIEYMDVGTSNGWRLDDVIPSSEVVRRLQTHFEIESASPQYLGEVAQRWRYCDGSTEFGVIASVTQAFCQSCTRARLSTDGTLYTCLFAQGGTDLRGLLRSGASDQELSGAIASVWSDRDDRYSEVRTAHTIAGPKIEMSYIGG